MAMDPCSMSLDEIIQIRKQSTSGIGFKKRRISPTSLGNFPLDDAFPIMEVCGEIVNPKNCYFEKDKPLNQVVPDTASEQGRSDTKIKLVKVPKVEDKEEEPLNESSHHKKVFSYPKMYDMCKKLDLEQPRVQVTKFPKLTPSQAVTFLAKMGMTIGIQTGMRENISCPLDRLRKWRCVITSGSIKVITDSFRKEVAIEMACMEFLLKLEAVEEVYIPKYCVSHELFIHPNVVPALEREAARRDLPFQIDMKIRPIKIEDGRYGTVYVYECIVFAGERAYRGESFVREYAKVQAAKNAFEEITGKTVVPTDYFTTDECDPALEFDFGELEDLQMSKLN